MKEKPRVCIYSSIYNDYDSVKEQARQTVPTDYILYTDKPVKSSRWKVVVDKKEEFKEPFAKAKWWKLHPPKGYEMTIWVDGTVWVFSPDFVENIQKYIGDYNIMMPPHPARQCLYDESIAHKMLVPDKFDLSKVSAQEDAYIKEKVPRYIGLFETFIIVRHGDTKDFDKLWWEENVKWGWTDQISAPYVIWKLSEQGKPQKVKFFENHAAYADKRPHNKVYIRKDFEDKIKDNLPQKSEI